MLLIADKGYDSDEIRDEPAEKTFCLFLCINRISGAHPVTMPGERDDAPANRSSKERFSGTGSFDGLLSATNTTVELIKLLYP